VYKMTSPTSSKKEQNTTPHPMTLFTWANKKGCMDPKCKDLQCLPVTPSSTVPSTTSSSLDKRNITPLDTKKQERTETSVPSSSSEKASTPPSSEKVPPSGNSLFNTMLLTASRISLSIFSLRKNLSSTLAGSIMGIGYGLYIGYLQSNNNPFIPSSNSSGCSEGFLERLAGVPFPEEINTLASLAATLEHLNHHGHHHSELFPFHFLSTFTGFSMGAYLGNRVWHVLPGKG
jgi:hypothetical protein